MRGSTRQVVLDIVVAFLVVALTLVAMRIPGVVRDSGGVVGFFFFAILIAAWYGGARPGLLVTATLVVLTLPHPLSFPLWRIVRLALFIGCGVAISVLMEVLHSARRKVEKGALALRRSEGQLRALVESITDHAIFTTDPEGRVVSWSPGAERLLGYTERAALGRQTSSFVEGEGDGPEDVGCDVWCIRKDGSRFCAAVSTSPLNRDGTPGTTWVLRDVTMRNRAEAELRTAKETAEAASRAKDQFLAALSHELRTPLTPALVTVTALMEDPQTPESIHPGLEVIRRNIGFEARLIDDLLDVTQISRGKLRLRREVADAHELVARAVEICRDDIATAGLALELDLGADEHYIEADPTRIQQIFWNLIKNAVKFTPRGGTIAIRSWNVPGGPDAGPARPLVIEVRDTGIGIEPGSLLRIFHAFEQGGAARTGQFGGLGLGLAICRSLAELHGGDLSAASDGKDRGATFTLTLPAVAARPKPVAQPPPQDSSAPRPKYRILLVEDNGDTLRVMSRLLRSRGYVVLSAGGVAEAVEAAGREAFDLLVSDIGLPDGTGYELMRKVNAHRAVPGIALSGYGMDEDLRKSREAGFATHLIKPVDFRTLEAAIQQVMASE